jgi:hypothetical protein
MNEVKVGFCGRSILFRNYVVSEVVVAFVTVSQIVHAKTATALCLTSVKNEDKHEFSKIVEAVNVLFWHHLVIFLILFSGVRSRYLSSRAC